MDVDDRGIAEQMKGTGDRSQGWMGTFSRRLFTTTSSSNNDLVLLAISNLRTTTIWNEGIMKESRFPDD